MNIDWLGHNLILSLPVFGLLVTTDMLDYDYIRILNFYGVKMIFHNEACSYYWFKVIIVIKIDSGDNLHMGRAWPIFKWQWVNGRLDLKLFASRYQFMMLISDHRWCTKSYKDWIEIILVAVSGFSEKNWYYFSRGTRTHSQFADSSLSLRPVQ